MVRVLFVCLGNICRSPTAEAVMRSIVAESGLEPEIELDSAGTGGWHVGESADARASAAARARGIELTGAARQIKSADLDAFDYVVAMDRENLAELRALARTPEQQAKLLLLRELDEASAAAGDLDVPDPYFGGDEGFERVLDLLESGCRSLLQRIAADHGLR